MTMEWLFGNENQNGPQWQLQPRVYDIDIVHTVHRMLLTQATRDLELFEAASTEAGEGASGAPPERSREHYEARMPSVRLSEMLASSPSEPVALEQVNGLLPFDRGRIVVSGAGITVLFNRSVRPWVYSDGEVNHELVEEVVRKLRSSGRRRPQRYALLSFLPIAAAIAITAAGIWALVDANASAATSTFVGCILAAAWAGAGWISVRVSSAREDIRHQGFFIMGHRFREGSLSGVRDRIQNARATAIVSLVTIPVGAVIGWLLKEWLG